MNREVTLPTLDTSILPFSDIFLIYPVKLTIKAMVYPRLLSCSGKIKREINKQTIKCSGQFGSVDRVSAQEWDVVGSIPSQGHVPVPRSQARCPSQVGGNQVMCLSHIHVSLSLSLPLSSTLSKIQWKKISSSED
uniref:Uncharacterized protein n=1 Tax=Myotis myotis TaxID=51298 RepID=A0A7J7WVU0_MYOMY|nr:hypothetical protein mMyoMyo1_011909 [Myotis myotis]